MGKDSVRMGLKSASFYVLLAYGAGQFIRLGSNLILTRLLEPEYFGLMAFGFSILFVLTMLCDVGVYASIIRSKDGDTKEFRKTAFTIQASIGLLISLLVSTLAVGILLGQTLELFKIGTVFNHKDTGYIILLLAIQPFITGLKSTKLAIAQKQLNLKPVALIELGTQIVGTVVTIYVAYLYPSIWVLVFGSLLATFLLTLATHVFLSGGRDRFGWDKESSKSILSFGKWILLSSLITAIVTQIDKFVFAALISPQMMGVFSIALLLHLAVYQALSMLNSKVFFPKFSAEYNKNGNLKHSYYSIRKYSDLISYFAFSLIYFCGELAVRILFTKEYHTAGSILSVLAFQFLFNQVLLSNSMYMAIGKPKLSTLITAIEAVSKTFLVIILYQYGGFFLAIYGCSIYAFISLIMTIYLNRRLSILCVKTEFKLITYLPIAIGTGKLLSMILQSFLVFNG